MNPLRLSVRFAVTGSAEAGLGPDRDAGHDLEDVLEPAISTFHRFIQRGKVEGFVLDVADYRHIDDGPGVLLVGHDIEYRITPDAFTTVRKRSQDGDAATQLRDALRMALGAMDAVEADESLAATFDRSRFSVTVHDRSLGSPEEVAPRLREAVAPTLDEVYGDGASVEVVVPDDQRVAPSLEVTTSDSDGAAALDALGGARIPNQSDWDIEVEELRRLLAQDDDEVILLDVRDENEYETVNIGGRLAPLAQLGDAVEGIPGDAKVVVHCRSGSRGAKAVAKLRDAGYSDAWNVNGGLMAWIDRIDPSLTRY